ncbi:hypothetical protein NDU88_003533 [Pleurodeles waltl]|uniref:Uncharacterized protein n=1 Tax=Pleurodeles waltl TaxID=8319 RepID=A0AAV7M4K7_PLEWA|nr:hypothetical protein NDU88_003533 [Pleurodeles waltl]
MLTENQRWWPAGKQVSPELLRQRDALDPGPPNPVAVTAKPAESPGGRARWCRRSGEARKPHPPEPSTKPLLPPPLLRNAVPQQGFPLPEEPSCCCWVEDCPCSFAEGRGGARLFNFLVCLDWRDAKRHRETRSALGALKAVLRSE